MIGPVYWLIELFQQSYTSKAPAVHSAIYIIVVLTTKGKQFSTNAFQSNFKNYICLFESDSVDSDTKTVLDEKSHDK